LFEIERPLYARKLISEEENSEPSETEKLRLLVMEEERMGRERALKERVWYSMDEEEDDVEEDGNDEIHMPLFLRGGNPPSTRTPPSSTSLSFVDKLAVQLQSLDFLFELLSPLSPSPLSDDSPLLHRRLDTFGDSVVHVNQLYHRAFGVKQRKVRQSEGRKELRQGAV